MYPADTFIRTFNLSPFLFELPDNFNRKVGLLKNEFHGKMVSRSHTNIDLITFQRGKSRILEGRRIGPSGAEKEKNKKPGNHDLVSSPDALYKLTNSGNKPTLVKRILGKTICIVACKHKLMIDIAPVGRGL